MYKKTPASTPFKLKNAIKNRPIIGPIIILVKEFIKETFNEKTFNLVNAIPRDISTKKIVAYAIRKVAFSKIQVYRFQNIKK